MKNFLSVLLFMAVMSVSSFCFTACGDDDSEDSEVVGGNIIGTWMWNLDDYNEMIEEFGKVDVYIHFWNDGKLVYITDYISYDDEEDELEIEYGTFNIDGDKIIVTWDNGEKDICKFKISGNTLTVSNIKSLTLPTTWNKVKDSSINKYLK